MLSQYYYSSINILTLAYNIKKSSISLTLHGVRKNAPGKKGPRKKAPEKIVPRKYAPRKTAPRKIVLLDFCCF